MGEAGQAYPQLYSSFRTPWAQLDPFLLQLFSRGFPADTRASFNYATHKEDSTVLVTQSVVRKSRERVNNFQSGEQADVRVGVGEGRYAWLKFSSDEIKLHYHHGVRPLWQPYLSFSSTRKFKNSSFKLGLLHSFPRGHFDVRLRYNVGEHRADTFYYAKGAWAGQRLRVSCIATAIRKLRQIYLQKNDLSVGFQVVGGNWLGLVLENDGFRNYKINYSRLGSYFDSLKAVYLLDLPSLTLGLLYEYSIEDSASKKIEAAVEYRSKGEGQTVRSGKVRLNTQWEMGIAVQAGRGSWRLEGGTSWSNVSKSVWPSYYTVGLSFY